VIQLGDLVDNGPDSAGTLRAMLARQEAGDGLFLLGNHDHKLARALMGRDVTITPELVTTMAQLDTPLRARALAAFSRAPAWLRLDNAFFVHGGFHTAMLATPSPTGIARATGPVARALYGEPTGRTRPDGYPERSLAWVRRIPPNLTVYCGHDNRSTDGRPAIFRNPAGGSAIFLDTGAGKGGHLSWLDLPTPAAATP